MNKANGPDIADRLSSIVANSLDTQTKTQELARQAYQSRTQFHRLFRNVVAWLPEFPRRHCGTSCEIACGSDRPGDDGCCWNEPRISWHTSERRSRMSHSTPALVHWKLSLAPSARRSASPPAAIGAYAIRTFIYRRPTRFTSLPRVPQQKEEETWIYSIVLQATTPGTHGACWNMRAL